MTKWLTELHFAYWNGLIYYIDNINGHEHLCISICFKKKIFKLTHDQQHHSEFYRIYNYILTFLFLCCLIRHLKIYIHHCSECQLNQTKQHSLYSSLNLISTSVILFYMIIMNFVLVLLVSSSLYEYDNFLTVTDKFTKQVLLLFSKFIYTVID